MVEEKSLSDEIIREEQLEGWLNFPRKKRTVMDTKAEGQAEKAGSLVLFVLCLNRLDFRSLIFQIANLMKIISTVTKRNKIEKPKIVLMYCNDFPSKQYIIIFKHFPYQALFTLRECQKQLSLRWVTDFRSNVFEARHYQKVKTIYPFSRITSHQLNPIKPRENA